MNPSPDARIAQIASRQQGLFTVAQAASVGLSRAHARTRVDAGRWERITRGVYRIAGVAPTWQQHALAATLARPTAAVSHVTAAALAGLVASPPMRPHLIVAPSGSARSPIATVHRIRLEADDITIVQGIRTTTPARTLVDCASVMGPRRVGGLIDEALHRRLTTPRAILAIAERATMLTSAQHLRLCAHLEVWLPTIEPDSPAEARLLRLIESWGFPIPERQIKVHDESGQVIARLDGGWSAMRIGFEYDSVRWHGPTAWASDEERHQRIEALGWRLVHIDKSGLGPGSTALRTLLDAEFAAAPVRLARLVRQRTPVAL